LAILLREQGGDETVSRNAIVRKILLDILREGQPENNASIKIKLLVNNAIVEGTLEPARNEKLLATPPNGTADLGADAATLTLIDVAIRPLSEPEVFIGMNELMVFLDKIAGVVR
jgi:hypothetical protein